MLTTSGHKRLDDVEIHLSPKQWAIQVAKEVRQYPNEEDFLNAVMKTEYRDCILFKPLFKLSKQAEARCPGKHRDDIAQRIHLSQGLKTEFQELKILIFDINMFTKKNAPMLSLEAALTAWVLQNLGLKDQFSRVSKAAATWIRRTSEGKGQSARMLRLLRPFTRVSPLESSQFESSIDRLVMLARNILNLEASVRVAQDRYFDGQAILFRNVEALLKEAMETTTGAIMQSEALFPFRKGAHLRAIRKRVGSIDLEQMKKDARAVATTDILRESGVNSTNCWRILRAMTSEELKSVKPRGGVAEG